MTWIFNLVKKSLIKIDFIRKYTKNKRVFFLFFVGCLHLLFFKKNVGFTQLVPNNWLYEKAFPKELIVILKTLILIFKLMGDN